MMAQFSTGQFAQRIVELKLVDPAELRALSQQFDMGSMACEEFCQLLVRRELLTNYQAARVARGEKEGYFYGNFKILYLISQGSFARVYRAVDMDSGASAALKILRRQYSKDKTVCDRFRREGEIGRSLVHPNIVAVRDSRFEQGAYFLVMEFVEGQSLQQFLNVRRKLPPIEATRIIKDVVSALHHAATYGYQHRDLKLTNVLLSVQGMAKLIDFGLAGVQDLHTPGEAFGDDVRTVDYAALEKSTNVKRGDPRSDLYFAGVMYYEMLTGVSPLGDLRDKHKKLAKSRFTETPPVESHDPSLPSVATRVVRRAMEPAAHLRYQTTGEMLVDVATALKTLELDAEEDHSPQTSATPVEPSSYVTSPTPSGKPMTEDSSSRDQAPNSPSPTPSQFNGPAAPEAGGSAGEPASPGAAVGFSRSAEAAVGPLVIYETDAKLQEIFGDKFRKSGYQVHVLGALHRALTRATDSSEPACGLLLNGDTGGKRTVEVYRFLDSHPRAKDLPVALILGEHQRNLGAGLPRAPNRVVLTMPLKMRELVAAVVEMSPPEVGSRDTAPRESSDPASRDSNSRMVEGSASGIGKGQEPAAAPERSAESSASDPPAPEEASGSVVDASPDRTSEAPDSSAKPTPPEPGPHGLGVVDNYELIEELGHGGMGTVYRALHRRMHRMVAIKILAPERMSSRRALARFHREIKAMARLNHPNIVIAHDAGEANGRHYLVMEYINGADLAELVKRCGPLLAPDAAEIIRRGAVGLQHAHEHGMVHRDIKPSNLLLEFRNAEVKVLDLGLALVRSETEEELTNSGQVLGTIEYMAPEQWTNTHGVDIRADIYSLGCTLYRLLTGHPPFSGSQYPNMLAKMMAHAQTPVPNVRKRRPDVPEGMQLVLEKMLAKTPEGRYSCPREVAEALAEFTADANLVALSARARAAGPARGPKTDV